MFLIGVVAAFVELIVLINVLNVNSPTETVNLVTSAGPKLGQMI